ncbi:hypothetical protein CPB84DRAFT_1713263 [Gymnopilus junonius]|uniref:Uncharacterized protein n=1 Tax=Gymnopilus junonius TaxID=109634 RepID=A0A9P5TJ13_GYMJU|nr:hypothetical protein CPB84DRAFT_1713263 [Gymnopilus junonius]
MHQGHNIPWDIISTNFRFVSSDTRYTPPFTGLISKERPSAPKEVEHFSKKFINAIRTFSETERRKYPTIFTPIMTGNIFSDTLRERYPRYLNTRNQRIEYWMLPHSLLGLGELADIIKVLLYENEMETLLMLAQHPTIRIAGLCHLHFGYHFGFSRVQESALDAYLFFNCADATGILENGKYSTVKVYYPLLRDLSSPGRYPAQTIPHIQFFEEHSTIIYTDTGSVASQLVHNDYEALHDYLKTLC